ncbi:olfactory receptor 5AR1-like [Leptodactylus fuscus]|uniref:olfactory receptor 5AR1-like n=1 Tax=Leptodactylus fuscus TaxID=238119 RepID=UPI003F4ED433
MNACPNGSSENEFYIVAFSMASQAQDKLFFGILIIYLMALLGNLIIIILICLVPKLHTPMYFFLCNLAIVDVTSTTSCIPKLLNITLTQDHRISFPFCLTQTFFFILCADGEIFILTSMAYDRYVAICKPLQYYTIMKKNVYLVMAASSWIVSALNALLHTLLTYGLQFCNSHDINNFLCDLNSVIALSSSDITSRKAFIFSEVFLITILQFLLTIISYVFIFSAILKIRSSAGRMKAFSSCTSHLITVILFYGPLTFLYTKPQSEDSKDQDMLLSMLYLGVVPMLNPLVYSLRNKEVWAAISSVVKSSESLRSPSIGFEIKKSISSAKAMESILKIRSSAGRMKAFSSCTSHLITVILFYGPLTILYMKPESEDSKDQDMLLSMLYLFVVPMLNPLVYSLRNKDVWEAILSVTKLRKIRN